MKSYSAILIATLFVFVFVLNLFQKENLDTFLHYAMGRVISERGIINYDPFGHHGGDLSLRQYIPSEWLFQVFIYKYLSTFGFSAYKMFVSVFAVLQVGVVFLFFLRILRLNLTFSLLLSLNFALLCFEFFVSRPYIIASFLFITTLYLILRYVLQNKNQLILILPIVYLWVNLHPSIFLGLYLAIAYSFICWFLFLNNNERVYLKKAKVLLLLSLGIFIVSVLPPVGFGAYQFVLYMLGNSTLLKELVSEWAPLSSHKYRAIFYSLFTATVTLSYLIIVIRKKSFVKTLWVWPIVVLILPAFFNIRNIYFGLLASNFILGIIFKSLETVNLKGLKRVALGVSIGILLTIEFAVAVKMNRNFRVILPVKAADFLEENNLKGNMFNQFAFGGYLEYRLYPKYKVFVDGRMDSYLCCELKDFYDLGLSHWQFDYPTETLRKLFEKYKISYAVLVKENDPQGQVFSYVLSKEPNWRLVFQDEVSNIWLKNDGNNSELFAKSIQYLDYNPESAEAQKFNSSISDMAFVYPKEFKAVQINERLIALVSKDDNDKELKVLFYITKSDDLKDDPRLPFKLNGELKQTIAIPNNNFKTRVVLYSDGVEDKQFFILEDGKRSIVVYSTPGILIDPQVLLNIVQSISKSN